MLRSWSRMFLAPPGAAALLSSGIAVPLVVTRRDIAAVVTLIMGALLLHAQKALRGRDTAAIDAQRALAADFVTWAAETALGAAALLAIGWSEGTREAIVAAWTIGFAVIVQEYARVVFARTIDAARLGPARDPGAIWGVVTSSRVAWVIAAYLAAGRPRLLLVAIAIAAAAGTIATSILRGAAVRRLEDRSRAPSAPPRAPRLRARERWKALLEGLRAARDEAFWGLVFARPVAAALLFVIGDVRRLTPNVVTTASMIVCLAAAGAALAGGTGWTIVAIVLVGVRSILDSLDGQLARYRGLSSTFGAFYDKVSDGVCWGALYLSFGVRAHQATGAAWMLIVPLAAAMVLYFQSTTYWLIRMIRPTVSTQGASAPLTWKRWALHFWRVVLFEEPDFYLWICLGLATGRHAFFVALIAFAYGARGIVALGSRIATAHAAWRGVARESTL